MRGGLLGQLLKAQRAAVAPTVGISLFALIGVGGIAFDYARLAAMDTELQNAADQAALAAVTQLDGTSTAITRATGAANNLVQNQTLFANDDDASGTRVTVPTLTFYSAYNSTTDTGMVTTDPVAAKFVEVTVDARKAFYALTPVVALMTDAEASDSGDIAASAIAGLGSAVCKVPPVMICNPQEIGGNTNFDIASLIGKGLKLVTVGPDGDPDNDPTTSGNNWAPGNFGYLDTHGGSPAVPGLREGLGWENPPGECSPQTGVDTKPGANVTVTDALNTRFDIYDGNTSCPPGGSCGASINSIKDVVRPNTASGNNACRLHNAGWQEVVSTGRYLPTSATNPLDTSITPTAMGHPRDMCHAVDPATIGYCGSAMGDGLWDRDAYFRTNYPEWGAGAWATHTGLSSSVSPYITDASGGIVANPAYLSRYNIYAWEIANRGNTVGGKVILSTRPATTTLTDHDAPICSSAKGYSSGVIPGGSVIDRRRLSVAVVNCVANSVNGNSEGVPVQEWMDVFLVEPSLNRDRTKAGEVYVEVVGLTDSGVNGATNPQVIQRSVPYLLK